jgi:hypothetical protein
MCLIVDANCFGCVFNKNAKYHHKFVPVYNWLLSGYGGRLIYGGSKYKKEVNFKGSPYRGILAELERKGRLLAIPDKKVNDLAAELKKKVLSRDFDDEHIVALVGLSKCCVVCTDDKRSFPFLRRRDLYPDGVKPPKIYQSTRNSKLCCSKHVVEICR